MLDAIRYMIVWNPIIFVAFTALSHLFPHHKIHHHIATAAGHHLGVVGSPPPALQAAQGVLQPPAMPKLFM
jgi:hypothetical protein